MMHDVISTFESFKIDQKT